MRVFALIYASAILLVPADGRAADDANANACRAACQKDYEACGRTAVTYEGYMACYRRASACSEGCGHAAVPGLERESQTCARSNQRGSDVSRGSRHSERRRELPLQGGIRVSRD